jgi:hypothetical protein
MTRAPRTSIAGIIGDKLGYPASWGAVRDNSDAGKGFNGSPIQPHMNTVWRGKRKLTLAPI